MITQYQIMATELSRAVMAFTITVPYWTMATVYLNIMIPYEQMIFYLKKIGAVLKHVCDVLPRAV